MYLLFKTHCMALCGSQLLDLSNFRVISCLFVSQRKAIRYILGLPSRTHSRLLHLICHNHPIEHQMHCRFVKFYRALCTSRNKLVSKCCELIRNGYNSLVSQSLSRIAHYFSTSRGNLYNFGVISSKSQYYTYAFQQPSS